MGVSVARFVNMKVARFVTRCVYEVGRRIAWFVIGFSTLVTCSRTAQPNTKVNLHQTVETVKVDTQPANPQNYIYICFIRGFETLVYNMEVL